MAAVLKTARGASSSWVRIPRPPHLPPPAALLQVYRERDLVPPDLLPALRKATVVRTSPVSTSDTRRRGSAALSVARPSVL